MTSLVHYSDSSSDCEYDRSTDSIITTVNDVDGDQPASVASHEHADSLCESEDFFGLQSHAVDTSELGNTILDAQEICDTDRYHIIYADHPSPTHPNYTNHMTPAFLPESFMHMQPSVTSNTVERDQHLVIEDNNQYTNFQAEYIKTCPTSKRKHFRNENINYPNELSDIYSREAEVHGAYVPKRCRIAVPNGSGQSITDTLIEGKIFDTYDEIRTKLNLAEPTRNYLPSQLCFSCHEHKGPVHTVEWNKKGNYSHLFLSSSSDGTVCVWNLFTKKCVRRFTCSKAVRCATWDIEGQHIASGGYHCMAVVTDVLKGQEVFKAAHKAYVSSIRYHTSDAAMLITGTQNAALLWDTRTPPKQPVRSYAARMGMVQDVLVLRNGSTVFTCGDVISRDSDDKTIMAWDYRTGAILSNQIYQERYMCTCLREHPSESQMFAQSSGAYIAQFSTQRPYKMNKHKRFEGHQFSGHAIQCACSPDGDVIASGSSDGQMHFYNYRSSRPIRKVAVYSSALLSIDWHPVLPSAVVVSSWDGEISTYK